ncbi:cytochrome c [Paraglaciecola aquimarina]|uniref:Cytochrome c n=1 Tax=Paraglaciecola aquimarina TaxID=1235557 RepID=A0ABU3SS93_9ALTE|nr:cytochrome c [Paraglaciecola aquimarina]MDU0352854.1 cytochrome c [Paraglaciecola aquimarina]
MNFIFRQTLKSTLFLWCFAGSWGNVAYANQQGEKAFKANCQACHALDRFSTGPSLVYIRDAYPKSALSAFLAWAKNPWQSEPRYHPNATHGTCGRRHFSRHSRVHFTNQ